ncbi:MAG: glycosyltransferase, partial [Promicromonosporaceae bacterium]|nr:glycosyltransferase [Promicromonosporaceae bacterium]
MSSRPRVALATRIYRPEAAAAAFRLGALVDALVEAGAEVDVLTTTAPRSLTALAAQQDAATPARVRRFPVRRDAGDYVRGDASYASFDLPLFFRLLTTRRPGVVVVEPPPTTGVVTRLVCALRRLPYVAYVPDLWSDGTASTAAPRMVKAVVRACERLTLRGARAVIFPTPTLAARASTLHRLDPRRVRVVPNGVDTDTFTAEGPPAEHAPAGPYAVYAGTTSEWQGADILARAWGDVLRRVPTARLVFLGQGTDAGLIRSLAEKLPDGGASILQLPLVPPAEAAAWQRGATVALCTMRPNIAYNYFTPTKVFAAAACGTPTLYIGPGPAGDLVREAVL